MSAKAFEEWAKDKKTAAWLLAGVRAHTKWGQGREVSEADFDAAASEVSGLKIGGGEAPEALTETDKP